MHKRSQLRKLRTDAEQSRSARKSHGEIIQAELLDGLNGVNLALPVSSRRRVEWLVENFQAAAELELTLIAAYTTFRRQLTSRDPTERDAAAKERGVYTWVHDEHGSRRRYYRADLEAVNQSLMNVGALLNQALRRYKWSPMVRSFYPNDALHFYFNDDKKGWENAAVLKLMLVTQQGLLNRVRKCKVCRKWFYALVDHQEFCKGACRQKHASESEEFKKSRREYMQRIRREDALARLSEPGRKRRKRAQA